MGYPDGTLPTPPGVEVHPTPIYETVTMLFVAWLLWRNRKRFQPGLLFAAYLVLAGLERFLIEFLRRNDDVFLGITQAQLVSLVMIFAGAIWIARKARSGELRAEGDPGAEPSAAT